MRTLIVLLGLFSCSIAASDKEEIELLNGKWRCSADFEADGFKFTGDTLDHYKSSSMTYSMKNMTTIISEDGSILPNTLPMNKVNGRMLIVNFAIK